MRMCICVIQYMYGWVCVYVCVAIIIERDAKLNSSISRLLHFRIYKESPLIYLTDIKISFISLFRSYNIAHERDQISWPTGKTGLNNSLLLFLLANDKIKKGKYRVFGNKRIYSAHRYSWSKKFKQCFHWWNLIICHVSYMFNF